MNSVADIVLPVFGLIGLGYLAAWSGMLTRQAGEAITDFVFLIPIPLLLFRTVAYADFTGGSPWRLWAAYFVAYVLIWATASLMMRRLFGRDHRAGLVGGITASYSNVLLVGLPLGTAAYGEAGAAVASLLVAVHLPVMMTVGTLMIDRALRLDGAAPEAAPDGWVPFFRRILRNLAVNPVIIAIVAGFVWRNLGVAMPSVPAALLDRLAGIAATLALFTLGMSLRNYGISGNLRPSLALTVLKLGVMPAIVAVAAFWVLDLPPLWAKAVVLAAACPSGVNAYLVAARFRTGQGLSSNTITITTGAAVVTIALWLQILALI